MNNVFEKNFRGIYIIKSLISDKVYVGKFSKISFEKRKNIYESYLRRNKHHSKKLQNFFNKYGFDFLKFEILEIVPDSLSESELNDLESFYIKKYKSFTHGFNMSKGGEGAVGAVRSKENREQISKSLKNSKLVASEVTREKISKSSKNKKPVKIHGVVYESASKASKIINIPYNTIIGRLHRKHKNYEYVSGLKNPEQNKPHQIEVDGVVYNSIGAASQSLGYTRAAIRDRLKDERFPNYKSLRRLDFYSNQGKSVTASRKT